VQINQVTDIYSRLGRLGRSQSGPAEHPEEAPLKAPPAARPPVEESSGSREDREVLDGEAPLTASQARGLSDEVARGIIDMDSIGLFDDVHDLSGASLISPRYV